MESSFKESSFLDTKGLVAFESASGETFYITKEERDGLLLQQEYIAGLNLIEEALNAFSASLDVMANTPTQLADSNFKEEHVPETATQPTQPANSSFKKDTRYNFFGHNNQIPIITSHPYLPITNAPYMPLPPQIRHAQFPTGYIPHPSYQTVPIPVSPAGGSFVITNTSIPPFYAGYTNSMTNAFIPPYHVGSTNSITNAMIPPFHASSINDMTSQDQRFHSGNHPRPTRCSPVRSLVITNSGSALSQKSQLSTVSFNKKICFAIPPGMTMEELNAPPLSENDISYLLRYTMTLNEELRKVKKRMRNGKSLAIRDTRPPVPNRNPVPPVGTNSTSAIKPTKPRTENVATRKTENDIKKSVLAPRVFVNSNYKKDEALIEASTKTKSEGKRKLEITELLAMRNDRYENASVINSLKQFGILSFNSPHADGLCKRMLIHERKNSEWVPSTALLHDVKCEPLNWKDILRDSWLDSGDEEDINSKQIYKHLKDMEKNFKNEAVEKIADNNDIKIETKKKKKSKLENPAGQTNGIDENDDNFDEYYNDETIENGLKNGTLLKATLRINSKNDHEAFISCQNNEKDIFINGVKDRNRALDGDEVVVEIYFKTTKKNVSNESEESVVQKCGKVVGISALRHPRTVVGYLRYSFSKRYKGFILHPTDNKIPKIRITRNSVPLKLRHHEKCNTRNVACLAKIVKWENVKFAEGLILEQIVEKNGVSVETKCILLENSLDTTPFEKVDEYLPSLPYEIPAVEMKKRLDIRHRCVFTIDPLGAKDLDDALSCTLLPNGNTEVGVHIADVTHFLASGTPLDEYAREKATSVYLTDAVFHMLPQKLCELCSLTPMEDKLTFSLFVELDEQANIVSHRFCKTMIRSCAQLTYAHAQAVIEGTDISLPTVVNGYTAEDCITTISRLHALATKMRTRRFKEGALKIDNPKLLFTLDKDGSPVSFSLYVGQECNWLVEEFMLLANVLAANRIMNDFPDIALLRYHSAPNKKALSTVVENLEKVGICIEASTAGSIYKSMMQYEGTDEIGIARMTVITNLLIKPMVKACYTCSSSSLDSFSEFWHYALNIPFYTHFTSPIRRYADIVVHRLLAASLGYHELPDWKPDEISEIAENCNKKKNSAKKAAEASAELYLLRYLEKCGPLTVRAVVTEVRERYFEVIDLSTRNTHRIYVNTLTEASNVHFEDGSLPSLNIKWKTKKNETCVQLIQMFRMVDVRLSFLGTPDKRKKSRIIPTLLKPIPTA